MNVLKKYYDGHGLDMENPTIQPTVKYYSVQFTNDIYFNCIYRSSQSLVTHEYVEAKVKTVHIQPPPYNVFFESGV